jgi:hypothetical protein
MDVALWWARKRAERRLLAAELEQLLLEVEQLRLEVEQLERQGIEANVTRGLSRAIEVEADEPDVTR